MSLFPLSTQIVHKPLHSSNATYTTHKVNSCLILTERSWLVKQAVYEHRVKEVAMAVPLLCCAFDVLNVPSKRQVIVAGVRNASDTDVLLTACHAPFDPDKTVSLNAICITICSIAALICLKLGAHSSTIPFSNFFFIYNFMFSCKLLHNFILQHVISFHSQAKSAWLGPNLWMTFILNSPCTRFQ